MREFVHRFAIEHDVTGFDSLQTLGLNLTTRQRNAVAATSGRAVNPMTFADAWTNQFVSDKYGAATTHWRKLEDRVRRGVGNPCPLLLIGLPASIVTFDEAAIFSAEIADEDDGADN